RRERSLSTSPPGPRQLSPSNPPHPRHRASFQATRAARTACPRAEASPAPSEEWAVARLW
ncbi:hypothetical protein M9458_016228, partial [Cirrhinus mrigala]